MYFKMVAHEGKSFRFVQVVSTAEEVKAEGAKWNGWLIDKMYFVV
jgi:hypothetical protein